MLKDTKSASTLTNKSYVVRKKIGRPQSKSTWMNARTPFEALRFALRMERKDWGELIDYSVHTLRLLESGSIICSVPLAKRMIEEARKMGIAITLDELYQHVIPSGMEEEVLRSLSVTLESESAGSPEPDH